MNEFLLLAFLFLIAGVIAVPIASRLGLGSVLGYLLAGIAISPLLQALKVDVVSARSRCHQLLPVDCYLRRYAHTLGSPIEIVQIRNCSLVVKRFQTCLCDGVYLIHSVHDYAFVCVCVCVCVY